MYSYFFKKGSNISLLKAISLVHSIFVKNRLNETTREEIIKAIDLLLPNDHCFPKTLYRFEKFFDKRKETKKYICLICDTVNDTRNCINCEADKEKDFSISCSYDIKETVQTLVNSNLEGNNFLL